MGVALLASVNKGNGCGQELKKKRLKCKDSGGCQFNKPTNIELLRDVTLVSISSY